MTSGNLSFKESVDLLKIKTNRLIEGEEYGYLLKDDIWDKGTLILKSGVYLTERIVNKLLNFGIKKVNIAVPDTETEEVDPDTHDYSINQFIGTQNVLIIEKNLINASLLVKELINMGFKEGNIFVTKEPSSINSHFRAKQMNFLFLDNDLYDKSAKCVEKYSFLRNTHVFVLANLQDLRELLKKDPISGIKFILKTDIEEKLNPLVKQALNQNFLNFWSEEEVLIS